MITKISKWNKQFVTLCVTLMCFLSLQEIHAKDIVKKNDKKEIFTSKTIPLNTPVNLYLDKQLIGMESILDESQEKVILVEWVWVLKVIEWAGYLGTAYTAVDVSTSSVTGTRTDSPPTEMLSLNINNKTYLTTSTITCRGDTLSILGKYIYNKDPKCTTETSKVQPNNIPGMRLSLNPRVEGLGPSHGGSGATALSDNRSVSGYTSVKKMRGCNFLIYNNLKSVSHASGWQW